MLAMPAGSRAVLSYNRHHRVFTTGGKACDKGVHWLEIALGHSTTNQREDK
jgi:hypothetical protein